MFQKVMVFDGGFGSELNKYNFPLGTVPEELNITNSDVVKAIHKNYVNANICTHKSLNFFDVIINICI